MEEASKSGSAELATLGLSAAVERALTAYQEQRERAKDPLESFNNVFVPIVLGLSLQVMIVSAFAPRMLNARVGIEDWPSAAQALFFCSMAFIVKYVQGNSLFAYRLSLEGFSGDPGSTPKIVVWSTLLGFVARVAFLVFLPLFVISSFYYPEFPVAGLDPSPLGVAIPVLSSKAWFFGGLLLLGYVLPNATFLVQKLGGDGLTNLGPCIRAMNPKRGEVIEVQQSWWMLNILTAVVYLVGLAVRIEAQWMLVVAFGINVVGDWVLNSAFYFGNPEKRKGRAQDEERKGDSLGASGGPAR